MVQPIPTSVLLRRDEHVRLHGITRKGGRNRNWIDEHRFYNESWNSRRVSVVRGSLTNTTNASEEYMRWYMERTVTFVTNPTHQVPNPHGFQNDGQLLTMMRQGMSQFYQMPGNEIVNNLAGYYMNFSHADHGAYLPAHVIENPVHVEVPHVPERITRRARGRGRGRGRGRVGGQRPDWLRDLSDFWYPRAKFQLISINEHDQADVEELYADIPEYFSLQVLP
ncbi:hypothetical protein QVD17_00697 [Tagetes erecta]|uniref:Uncharacterized protein n=1 Tax=Tagetes erecta TaxID=13708 RepID=A0AAD8P7G0_TARER|nr:hypothetical protein QVD17_00697 [Tagetes erecta]